MKKIAIAIAFFLAIPSLALADKYKLDHAHTRVGFEVSHMAVSTVEGHFKKFTGSYDFNHRRNILKDVKVEIEAASIDTNKKKRDAHLSGDDFFSAEKHPKITFVSTGKTKVRKGRWVRVKGKLTMRGVTRTVYLMVKYRGRIKTPWKFYKTGFDAKLRVNRYHYGVKWNKKLALGNLMVGKMVDIKIRVEGDAK